MGGAGVDGAQDAAQGSLTAGAEPPTEGAGDRPATGGAAGEGGEGAGSKEAKVTFAESRAPPKPASSRPGTGGAQAVPGVRGGGAAGALQQSPHSSSTSSSPTTIFKSKSQPGSRAASAGRTPHSARLPTPQRPAMLVGAGGALKRCMALVAARGRGRPGSGRPHSPERSPCGRVGSPLAPRLPAMAASAHSRASGGWQRTGSGLWHQGSGTAECCAADGDAGAAASRPCSSGQQGQLQLEPPGTALAAEDSSSSLGADSVARVAAACKGMGSAAGAGRFAAALPQGVPAINLSACGLWELPDLVSRVIARASWHRMYTDRLQVGMMCVQHSR